MEASDIGDILNEVWYGHCICVNTDRKAVTPSLFTVVKSEDCREVLANNCCMCLPNLVEEGVLAKFLCDPHTSVMCCTTGNDIKGWFDTLTELERISVQCLTFILSDERDAIARCDLIKFMSQRKKTVTMVTMTDSEDSVAVVAVYFAYNEKTFGAVYYYSWNVDVKCWLGQVLFLINEGKIIDYRFRSGNVECCELILAHVKRSLIYKLIMEQKMASARSL
jgi:hypothetical protein